MSRFKWLLCLLILPMITVSNFNCKNTQSTDQKTSKPDMSTALDVSLNIMTFNIRYDNPADKENRWDLRKELVKEIITNNNPDVIGLQEALKNQIDYLTSSLEDYDFVGVGRDDGISKGEYAAILYRKSKFDVVQSGNFWFSSTPDKSGSRSWGNKVTRICTWARFIDKETSIPFYVYNVHLDHESQNSREKSVILLTQKIRDRAVYDPFIVTGDFNTNAKSVAAQYMMGKAPIGNKVDGLYINPVYMMDTYRLKNPVEKEVGTFNEFKGKKDGDKIDFIFTCLDNTTLESGIDRTEKDGKCPSDHYPVTAKMKVKRLTDLEKKVREYEAVQNSHDVEKTMNMLADSYRSETKMGITSFVEEGRDRIRSNAETLDLTNENIVYVNLKTEGDTVICDGMEQSELYSLMKVNPLYYKAMFKFSEDKIVLESLELSQDSIDALARFQEKFGLWMLEHRKFEDFMAFLSPSNDAATQKKYIKILKEYRSQNP
jgi:endonuclease/exonuclease/phosphatase family metal-dependent hydrolase